MIKLIALAALFLPSMAPAKPIDLSISGMKHIWFGGIPKTQYQNSGTELVMEVDKSASFMLMPFKTKRTIKTVRFLWRTEGDINVKSKELEGKAGGDDLKFRLGLIISGYAPRLSMFAPSWIKAIRSTMHLTGSRLIYLAAGANHPPGSKWRSPFSSSITNISIASTKPGADGWQQATFTADKELIVVGLWLMADGDNSKSSFTTRLKDLEID